MLLWAARDCTLERHLERHLGTRRGTLEGCQRSQRLQNRLQDRSKLLLLHAGGSPEGQKKKKSV